MKSIFLNGLSLAAIYRSSPINHDLPGSYSNRRLRNKEPVYRDCYFGNARTMSRPVKQISDIIYTSGPEAIRRSIAAEIDIAIDVISRLDDLSYRRESRMSSSVGEQFRHNLDFLNTFLNGIDRGSIDYTRRERDPRVSTSRNYAVQKFENASRKISTLTRSKMSGLVSVRSEAVGSLWLPSSVIREMEFVLSHTIHHHALIGEKLFAMGISLDAGFGVGLSTRDFRRRKAA